jgi:hypothetical protein
MRASHGKPGLFDTNQILQAWKSANFEYSFITPRLDRAVVSLK